MSKLRNLPEITALEDNDLVYAVDSSVGTNGGRKITKQNLKESLELSDAEVKEKYENNADTNAFTDAEKSKLAGVETGATADQLASEVPYSNSVSGLAASDVQAAIDEVSLETQADFRPSIVSGRILRYTGGTARFDGTFFAILTGDILLNPNITNGEVYVDLDGLVKQTASGVLAPPYTIVFAKFSTDLNDIISLTDERVKNSQNIVRGILADVRDVRAGAAAQEGTSGRVSDAMHKHNVLTAAAAQQLADQANAEGVSTSLARADHVHNIPTAAPIQSNADGTNTQGSSDSFAKADHKHDVKTDDPVSQLPDQANAPGSSDALARADHVHNIPADVAVGLDADSANAEGAADSFARSDHTHDLSTGAPSSQAPDQANAEGSSANLARADHIHNIPAAAPTTNLSPASTNAEGVGTSFARNDHAHALDMAQAGNLSTVNAGDAENLGSIDRLARADHQHPVATAAAVALNANSSNTEGVSTSLARADHTHDLATGAVSTQNADQANAEGSSTNLARADHIHNIPTAAPSTIGTANSQGSAITLAKSDHVHNHGAQTDGTLHAVATSSVNGFLSAADKAKLDALVFGFLSYTHSSNQSTTQNNTAYTALSLDTDTGSFANSLLTKSSATQIRTDFNGYIKVSFKILAQNTSANDVAWRAAVLKNGTAIPSTELRANGKTNADRFTGAAGTFIIPCAVNDLFTFGFSNAEAAATNTITAFANGLSVSVHAMYKTS